MKKLFWRILFNKKYTIKKNVFIFLYCVFLIFLNAYKSNAQAISKYIVVDQFGYRPTAQKVAVLRDPFIGFDAAESFTPGSTYALVNTSTNTHVFTGVPTIWQNGKIDSIAGDKVWWFDFSLYTTPGSYYVLDVQKNVRSYAFDIKEDVYNEVLKQAVRFFFYQRSGFSKQLPYAEVGWVDGASHLKPLQDKNCRYYLTPNDASSEKDLHGGWYDAGDFNKYTSWTGGYIIALLKAYEDSPTAWTDDFNIPESNNSIPDILDEVKWGMDYLLRLQNSNGSVISLVGVQSASPPSSATQPSKYANPTTAATLKAAAAYAFGAKMFRKIGLSCYADTLQNAAIKAWNSANANQSVTWDNSGTGIGAGNPEVNDYGRLIYKLEAAEHLFAITNDAKYRTFFDDNYSQGHLIQWYYAFPYEHDEQEVLLYYTTLANATPAVVSTIKDRYLTAINGANNFGAFDSKKSSYLAYLESYVWGSSNINSLQGLMFFESVKYNINPTRNVDAMKASENYIHYIHGLNPLNQCYLTNMNKYGADKSATQLFHSWFMDGSAKWDQVGVSTYGPAPGFLVGGANGSYNVDGCCANNSCGSASNNALCNNAAAKAAIGQPSMKSFADINNGWPLNTWSITEPSCGYQVAYIRLLSKFVKANGTNLTLTTSCNGLNSSPTVSLTSPTTNTSFCQGTTISLTATAADSDGSISKVEFYDGVTLLGTSTTSPYTYNWSTAVGGAHTLTAKATDNAGKSTVSSSINIIINTLPVITSYVQVDGGAWSQQNAVQLCAGSRIVLGPQPTVAAGWTWTGPNGYSATSREITLTGLTAAQGGVYTASYTDVNTCKATSTFTLTVNALPTATITTTTPTAFCFGGSVVLTASTGTSYKWFNGTTQVGTLQTYAATTAGSYTVEVTNTANCKATSAATTVTVNALPTAAITTTSPTTFCQGGNVVLTASAGASYKWYNGTTQVGTLQTCTATTAGSYAVEVTNTANCKATSAATTVTVNTVPAAPAVIVTAAYCQNTTATPLTASGTGLKWYADNTTTTPLSGTPTPITTATGTTNYFVSQTTNGCESQRAQIAVTIHVLPVAVITPAGSTTIPSGGSVTLQANTGSGLLYKWFNASAQVGSASSYVANAVGSYTVEVTNAFGCKTTSLAVNVTAAANQPSIITFISPIQNASTMSPVTIEVNVTDADGGIVLVEYLDGNTVIGTNSLSPFRFDWTNPADGSHVITVRVTDSNGGITTSVPLTITTTSTTTGMQSGNTIYNKVYPVPARDAITVETDIDLVGAAFSIVNVMGQEMNLSVHVYGNNAQVDVSGLVAGTYVLFIRKDANIAFTKITIVK